MNPIRYSSTPDLIEQIRRERDQLRAENQRLRDQITRIRRGYE